MVCEISLSCTIQERQYKALPLTPPGVYAQVDFGQKKLRTKLYCQTVSNPSDFTPTMLALVKDGVVHLKVIWAVYLKCCNHASQIIILSKVPYALNTFMLLPVSLKSLMNPFSARCFTMSRLSLSRGIME